MAIHHELAEGLEKAAKGGHRFRRRSGVCEFGTVGHSADFYVFLVQVSFSNSVWLDIRVP
jgi:hypothetical protein